jgi:hypothetical protein
MERPKAPAPEPAASRPGGAVADDEEAGLRAPLLQAEPPEPPHQAQGGAKGGQEAEAGAADGGRGLLRVASFPVALEGSEYGSEAVGP